LLDLIAESLAFGELLLLVTLEEFVFVAVLSQVLYLLHFLACQDCAGVGQFECLPQYIRGDERGPFRHFTFLFFLQ